MQVKMDAPDSKPSHGFPIWFIAVGVLSGAGATYLAARLVYEQTILTWAQGPQMIGFSLAHSGMFLPLLLGVVVFGLWLVASLLWTVVAFYRGRRIRPIRWAALSVGVVIILMPFVPQQAWQRLSINNLATGPHAADHLSNAAATGDLATVKALLSRGIDINARNSFGTTALHGAAVEGQVEVIEYLIGQGADMSIRNSVGESVLGAARSMHRDKAVEVLVARGAPE